MPLAELKFTFSFGIVQGLGLGQGSFAGIERKRLLPEELGVGAEKPGVVGENLLHHDRVLAVEIPNLEERQESFRIPAGQHLPEDV